MTELIIPVKPLYLAKQRLSSVLTPSERAGLVLAMLRDLLGTVARVPAITTWVVSSDKEVLELAQRHACKLIEEPTVDGYNPALAFGLSVVMQSGKDDPDVAFIPADIPLASAADLSRLTAASSSDGGKDTATVRLAPSHDERGTNGLFLSSSRLVQPNFGENSFHRYRAMCQSQNIVPEILSGSSMALDIDTPIDLEQLRRHAVPSAASCYLHSLAQDQSCYGTHEH